MPLKEIPRDRKIEIFPTFSPMRIKYKDIIDLKAFYESLHEWLLEHDWHDGQKADYWETYYGERITQGNLRELWIQWRLQKDASGAPLRYYLDFNWHGIAITNAEVVKEGRKINVNKGEIEIIIKAFIEENYKEMMDKSPLLKPIKQIFSKRVYKNMVDQHRKELYQETYELQNWMKQWMKLKRYLPYEETKGFFTSQAWPSHLKE